MNYTLDSYGNFDVEQQILSTASKKKEELEKQNELKESEILYRFKIIKGYFLRLSWLHKKEFILSIMREIQCFNTLLKIINYVSLVYGKTAAYTDVSPQPRRISQQILLDHDRTIEKGCFKVTACEDLKWIATLRKSQQMNLAMDLLKLGGGGLMRKLYIPLVAIYYRNLLEDKNTRAETGNKEEVRRLDDVFNDGYLDDSDKYPQDHPLSIEIEKMRKKWEEMMEKSRREVFGTFNTKEQAQKKPESEKVGKKSKTGDKEKTTTKASAKNSKESKKLGKSQTDAVDWFQMLPIWIVKQILDYLDQKTLQNLKKVNHYWSYASDSILKERQARKFLDQSIEQMRSKVDPEILKQFDDDEGFLEEFYSAEKKRNSPREKRLKKLMNRGAILKKMVPKVDESDQIQSNLLTTLPRDHRMCLPLEKIMVFPRLIKEDLLLYKSYPCYLKDINIIIDVEGEIRRQRDTLSYSLSQQLSDTFSMSEANLEDW